MKETSKQSSDLSPTKRALVALNKMRAKVDALEREKNEPIAIIGMGCRFPGGGDNPEAFWQLLRDGTDTITQVPPNRWDVDAYYDPDPAAPGKIYCRYGGFLDDVETFDPQFFGISPREALSLDPQQRLLLEVSWEALEHANQSPDQLFESATGVFAGLISFDYGMSILQNPERIDAYFGTGNSFSVTAGRISYTLGLTGPSMTVDTSCSSSLIAAHLACHSLRRRECNLALACGVNLILAPILSLTFSKAGMLAPDGRCKTFDAAADGYVRGEGCGVIVLKRLSDAVADRDNILAVIRGTAVNQDGPSGGLTVPNGPSQEKVIRDALRNGGVDPGQVSYIEAHGTGTSLGDPIEIGALNTVFGKYRDPDHPLIVGSVKTNVGHLESAAGIASLIKVVLSLQHEEIPPHLHFREPNPHIPWNEIPVKVPAERTLWTAGETSRIAGVSSFGFSGTNAHVLVEDFQLKPDESQALNPPPVHLLTLSAKTETALRDLAGRYETYLADNSETDMGDVCFSANTGRSHFNHRLGVIAESAEQVYEKLAAFRAGQESATVFSGSDTEQPRIAFLFTGQGSQYIGMGRELYDTQPVFRSTLERCDEILRAWLEKPLLEVIYPEPGDSQSEISRLLNETAYTQPALFALEYALAELWKSWGIRPHAVMGHSVGEYVAACVAGVFSLEDGLKLIAERGRLMQALPRDGEMISLQTTEERAVSAISPYAGEVSIAATNGPRSIVISGRRDAVLSVADTLKNEGIKVKKLEVSHGFHSPLMEPMLTDFAKTLDSVSLRPPRIKLISNVTGELASSDMATPEYWIKHVRQPVRFSASMETLHQKGYEIFLEIGPKPVLLGMGRLCLPKNVGGWLPGLRPKRSDWHQLLQSLGELYVRGTDVDWTGFNREYSRHLIHLPTYPFQRQRYWLETGNWKLETGGLKLETLAHPLVGLRLNLPFSQEIRFESQIRSDWPPHLNDHKMFGTVVVPAASHISMTLSGVRQAFDTDACVIEELLLSRAITLSSDEVRTLQVILTPLENKAFSFQIVSIREGEEESRADSWILHSSGKVRLLSTDAPLQTDNAEAVKARCADVISGPEFYAALQEVGYAWGPSFQWVRNVWRNENEALCCIEQPSQLPDDVRDYQLYPGLLDACFQVLGSFGKADTDESSEHEYSYMPFRMAKFEFYKRPEPGGRLWGHVRIEDSTGNSENQGISGNISFFDDLGQMIAEVTDFEFRKTSRETLMRGLRKESDEFYEIIWKPLRQAQGPLRQAQGKSEPGSWLIFADKKGFGERLADRLKVQGEHCVMVFPSQAYEVSDDAHYLINPAELRDFQRLLQECGMQDGSQFRGIIHLWGLDETQSSTVSLQSSLHLIQAMAQTRWSEYPRLWLITQGAQAIGPSSPPLQVHQSPLWGLGQVISLEHPELHCVRVDLDPSADRDNEIQSLFEEIRIPDEESQIAWREGVRYVARFVQSSELNVKSSTRLRPDSSYLITGGTGALGLMVASQLVKQGAKHLILMSRGGASDENAGAIAQMRETGADVLVLSADASNEKDVTQAFEKIKVSMPQLRGIIHAAGVLDDGVLIQQNWERFQKVMAPKAEGAWHLHILTRDMPLDFFVCFSSIASLFGSPAQGNYAAANAFLDALAYHRRATGLPGLSINWGPWDQTGMAASVSGRDQVRWSARGVNTLAPEKGVEIFARLFQQNIARIGVFQVNWPKFLRQFSQDMPLFFEAFSQSYSVLEKVPARQSQFLRQLEAAPPEARQELLAKHIPSQVAKILGLNSAEDIEFSQSLFEIGMDSLMAVELKDLLETDVGHSLRSTLLFDYPTVDALTDYLTKEVLSTDVSEKTVKDTDIQSEILSEVESLSEDKLNAAIDEELNALLHGRN